MTVYVLGLCAAILWAGSNSAKSDTAALVDCVLAVALAIAAVLLAALT